MNLNYWFPWREYPQEDTEDSEPETTVISGDGDGRVIVNESEQEENTTFGVKD